MFKINDYEIKDNRPFGQEFIIRSDGANIPVDNNNKDYQEYIRLKNE